MRRRLTGLATGVLAVGASVALAGESPPPLSPPVLGPPVSVDEPPGELPLPVEANPFPDVEGAPPENRPMLVIPGVNTPRPGQRHRVSEPSPAIDRPPVVAAPVTGPTNRGPADPSELPLILESEIAPPSDREGRPPAVSRPAPAPTPTRRPPGLFGRLFPAFRNDREPQLNPGPSQVDLAPRAAEDLELERRIERQIERELGTRLRTFDARVVGKDVVIHAETLRFWQRRSVRRELESLPGLAGYRVVVMVDE
ncbi:MAG: hypothetical protein AB7I30_01845 [Isosphaeraceae bacterium]